LWGKEERRKSKIDWTGLTTQRELNRHKEEKKKCRMRGKTQRFGMIWVKEERPMGGCPPQKGRWGTTKSEVQRSTPPVNWPDKGRKSGKQIKSRAEIGFEPGRENSS